MRGEARTCADTMLGATEVIRAEANSSLWLLLSVSQPSTARQHLSACGTQLIVIAAELEFPSRRFAVKQGAMHTTPEPLTLQSPDLWGKGTTLSQVLL
jgi:hypothetical protein